MAEIPIIAQPFVVMITLLGSDTLAGQQGNVSTSEIMGKAKHAMISSTVYPAIGDVI
jgi:hypothetical protein